MSPRQRPANSVLAITCLIAFLLCADFLIRNSLVMPSFIRLENHLAQKDIIRCVEAITGEQNHLGKQVTDWAVWDDTYEFADDLNSEYLESNLQPEALVNAFYLE